MAGQLLEVAFPFVTKWLAQLLEVAFPFVTKWLLQLLEVAFPTLRNVWYNYYRGCFPHITKWLANLLVVALKATCLDLVVRFASQIEEVLFKKGMLCFISHSC